MKEKPILFKGEMVRAILDGRKTQTRRLVKAKHIPFVENLLGGLLDGKWNQRPFPHGQPGDSLWVKETFCLAESTRADGHRAPIYRATMPIETRWKPSLFMPRWASRITLEITAVRCERLQDIQNRPLDIAAEGMPADTYKGDLAWYRDLWESINGPGSWALNPWVWVILFRKL